MNYSPLSLSRSLAAVLALSLHLYSGSSCSEGSLQGWRCCRRRVLWACDEPSAKRLTRHLVRMPCTMQSALAVWAVWDDPNWMWASICLVSIYLRSHFTPLSSSASPCCVQLPVQAPPQAKPGRWIMFRANVGSGEGCFLPWVRSMAKELCTQCTSLFIKSDAREGWWAQGLPNLLQQLVNFAFDVHLPPFQPAVLCRWPHRAR